MFKTKKEAKDGELSALLQRVQRLEQSQSKKNVIWEAQFKKSLRLVRDHYSIAQSNQSISYFDGPGIVREFAGSDFLIIAFTESNTVTFFDKQEVTEINLDSEAEDVK